MDVTARAGLMAKGIPDSGHIETTCESKHGTCSVMKPTAASNNYIRPHTDDRQHTSHIRNTT